MNNDLIQTIMTRTSIRAFQDKPVSDETVEVLLKAAMAAPSAKNSQPWSFTVIRDRALLEKLGDSLPNAKMTATAPVSIRKNKAGFLPLSFTLVMTASLDPL